MPPLPQKRSVLRTDRHMGLAPHVPAREDGSYALASAEEQARRRVDLHAAHIAPLTVFVNTIRVERRLGGEVPYIDPQDGGTHARALFLLEAPGPKAVRSGFISRDNPDPSARNFRALLTGAGIEREQTLLWNIVPWYIGTETKIRAAGRSDIRDGAAYLPHLLALLPELQAVVLVGRKAQKARPTIAQLTSARIFGTLHPSNQVVTCWPEKRKQVEHDLRAVAAFLAAAAPARAIRSSGAAQQAVAVDAGPGMLSRGGTVQRRPRTTEP